jgi:Fe-S cluster assembly iron-binding protein IscA
MLSVLTLTPDATDAIEHILEAPGTPEGAGIRIASASLPTNSASPSPEALQLTVAEQPETGDEVIDHAGARVFVEDTIAPLLDDKQLEAKVVDERVHFSLAERL